MHSIWREKYSISTWFYLFCFLLIQNRFAAAQEVLWSHAGLGARPGLVFLDDEEDRDRVLVYSSFANRVVAVGFRDGQESWTRTFPERIPYSPLSLAESVVVQGDQGTLWALNSRKGERLWEVSAPEPLDFPIAPPRFREQALFTLSRNGILRKISKEGRILATVQQPNSWGDRKAKTVPLRSFQSLLTFLDQSGRILTYDPVTMQLSVLNLWAPAGQLTRAFGRSREALAGALSPDRQFVWTVELPGVLRGYKLETKAELWKKGLGDPSLLFSAQGELLAVPTAVVTEELTGVFLCTRKEVAIRDGASGEVSLRLDLPSDAVQSPSYDPISQRWWVLCHEHLVSVDQRLQAREVQLPIVETPYSFVVRDGMAVIGTLQGRIFGIKIN